MTVFIFSNWDWHFDKSIVQISNLCDIYLPIKLDIDVGRRWSQIRCHRSSIWSAPWPIASSEVVWTSGDLSGRNEQSLRISKEKENWLWEGQYSLPPSGAQGVQLQSHRATQQVPNSCAGSLNRMVHSRDQNSQQWSRESAISDDDCIWRCLLQNLSDGIRWQRDNSQIIRIRKFLDNRFPSLCPRLLHQ